MNTGYQIPKVTAYWERECGRGPGWYVQVEKHGGGIATDSEKVTFPVDVADFGEHDSMRLRAALEEQFPEHRVCVLNPDLEY